MVDAGFAAEPDELAVAVRQPQRRADPPRGRARHPAPRRASTKTPSATPRRCRSAPPVAADVLRAGGRPTPLLQNCSGKHAAMLADLRRQRLGDRRLPRRRPPACRSWIDAYIAEAAGGVSHTGIDGCGAPTAMVTLVGLAPPCRSLAIHRTARVRGDVPQPDLVAGTGRDDTALMRAVPGLVAKGGAEGRLRRRPSRRSGGGREDRRRVERARVPVMLAALRSLGFDVDDVPVPPILGHGRPVGEVRSLVGDPANRSRSGRPAVHFSIWAASGPDSRRLAAQFASTPAGPPRCGRTSGAGARGTTARPLGSRPVRSSRPSAARPRRRPRRARDGGRGTPGA